ncbi:MAG: SDR family NAD(P)-dependent oxidoreductase [Candidatus Eremiobacteraeota bacterium]|nr:SDR family NAD(P)-dependent oxidoreductase [Candidatus Eremiobacteraeota bacterium]
MQTHTKALLTGAGLAGLAWAIQQWRAARPLSPLLREKTAFITGATRGLGLALARELAEAQCRIVLCARSQDELTGAAAELMARGAEVLPLICDVSQPLDVRSALAAARGRFGPIDILINNAGSIVVGPVESMDPADFQFCMESMFYGHVYTTLEVLPDMLERGGSILNVTSIGGRVTVPHLLPYCCAKAAAVAFSEGIRQETRGKNIRVLTAVPGLLRTGSYQNALFRGHQAEEYAWFTLSDNLPGLSMDARRAARQLLRALAADKGEHRATLAAQILAGAHGLLPGLVNEILAIVSSQLPKAPPGPSNTIEGLQLAEQMPAWLDRLTLMGKAAQRQYQLHRSI